MIRPKDEGVIHFRDVVIFGRQPEHRHRRNALLPQLSSQSNGRQRLVNGIGRSREQPHLLPGDHRHRARDAPADRATPFHCCSPAAPLPAPPGDRRDRRSLCAAAAIAPGIVRIVGVEPRNLVEMVLKIGKQRRGVRDLSVSKTGRLHHEQLSKRSRCGKPAQSLEVITLSNLDGGQTDFG